MEHKEYRQQMYEGKRMIKEKVKELAQKLHIEVAEPEWDEKKPILKVHTRSKSEKLEFSDEDLARYVESVNDRTKIDDHLRNLLRKLKARKGRYLGEFN